MCQSFGHTLVSYGKWLNLLSVAQVSEATRTLSGRTASLLEVRNRG